MSKKITRCLAWAAIAGATAAAFALTLTGFSTVLSFAFPGRCDLSLVHRISNAHLLWPRSLLLLSLEQVLQPAAAFSAAQAALLGFLAAGAALYLILVQHLKPAQAAILSAAAAIAVNFIVRGDFIVLSACAWFPWLCLALEFFHGSADRNSGRIVLGCVSILCALDAQFLAIVPAAFAVFYEQNFLVRPPIRNSLAAGLIVLLPAVLLFNCSPPAPVPDYPFLSHVVRDDGMIGNIQPLLGRDMPVQLIDRDHVRAFYLPAAILLTLLSGCLFIASALRRNKAELLGYAPALGLALAVLLDTALREPLAQVMPLGVIARTVPGLIYFPLSALVSAFSVISLIIFARFSAPTVRTAGTLVLACGAYFLVNPQIDLPGPQSPVPSELASVLATDTSPDLAQKLISPSYFTLASEGLHLHTQRARLTASQKVTAQTFGCAMRGSNPSGQQLAVDGDYETRWTSSSLGQHGKEWVELTCPKNTRALGIELSTGKWSTDFPRGLSVYTGTDCESLRPAYKNPSWQGTVRYTPDGYPHYQSQGHVKLFFRETMDVGCVRIEQIGSDKLFDWSIAEAAFLREPPAAPGAVSLGTSPPTSQE